jgi:tetratricopeptide (TPR) repeat protein
MPYQPLPNAILRQLMVEYGFTHEGLAEAVNTAIEHFSGTPGKCAARHVRRWLSGQVTWPRDHTRLALATIFGRSAAELGFIPPATAFARVTVRASTPAKLQEPPVLRRKFVLGLTGGVLALPPVPDAGRLGMADVHRIQTAAAKLHQIDDRYGGAQLVEITTRYVEYIEHNARRCTYGGNVQRGLYQALGEMATSAGWFAFDAGQQDVARRWWDTALRYAILARNKLLQARVWSSMSHQACTLGHGSEAVAIARAALDETRGRRDGQLSALLHTRVARGHAVCGEEGWCGRSLLWAEQDLDREPAEPQRWLGFFNAGEVSSARSLCFMDLRRNVKAVDAAREALVFVQSTPLRRNHLAAHVRLGRSLAAAGELEAAIVAGDDALALLREVRSPRVGQQLRQLRDELLDRSPAGAAEFSDRYEAVVKCPQTC